MTKHYFDYRYKDILNSLSKLNIKKITFFKKGIHKINE